jgi:hypothetical protein
MADQEEERAAMTALVRGSRRTEIFSLVGSGFVGALALAVSTYNVYLQRVQIRAQVWPHLESMYSNADTSYAFELENSGVGPAIVKGARVTVDETPVSTWKQMGDLLAKDEPALLRDVNLVTSTTTGRVVGPGASVHPLEVTVRGGAAVDHARLKQTFLRVGLQACYCSTLGDCWMTGESEPVRACPMDRLTFQQ